MEPIVPERGGRIGKAVGGAQNSPQRRKKPQPEVTPSVGLFWKMMLILLFACSSGLSVFAYTQYQALTALQLQFDDLHAKIDTTDESMSQSGAVMAIKIKEHRETLAAHNAKLKEHFSEIDKLWAARNKNKKAVDGSLKTVASLKSSLNANKKALNSTLTELARIKTSQLGSQAEAAETADRLDDVLVQLDRFEGNIKQWQVKTNSRIADTEEAVKAIDAFRHKVNQQLLALRTQSGVVAP